MSNEQPSRFACQVRGCGKSFVRKEHLTRHSRSHDGALSFVCNICSRAFNRNDVLQRHMARHTAIVDTSRNKRACDSCHASKIRCSGSPCTSCVKKGIACVDERDDGANQNSLAFSDSDDGDVNVSLAMSNNPNTAGGIHGSDAGLQYAQLVNDGGSGSNPTNLSRNSGPNISKKPNIAPPKISRDDLPIWLTAMEQDGHEFQPRVPPAFPQPINKSSELYFRQFHHRWPVIHAPTFDEKSDPPILKSSIQMIGCWLENGPTSRNQAFYIHSRLMEIIMPRLVSFPVSQRSFKDAVSLYQAAVLNIIFGFYTGVEDIITRVILMRNILIAVVRDLGLFRSDIKIDEDQPGVWFPFLWARLEERKRFAISLFEIDAYLALYRGEPPLMKIEELHFTLPSTFTLWNAPGIPVWETRNLTEPVDRQEQTIRSLNRKVLLERPMVGLVLPEDIHLGFCGLLSDVWLFSESRAEDSNDEDYARSRKKSDNLHQYLNLWKRLLDENRVLHFDDRDHDHERCPADKMIPESYYFGLEDHTGTEWMDIVPQRSEDKRLDTMNFYRVLRISLHTDFRVLRILRTEKNEGKPMSNFTQRHELKTREWAQSTMARRAMWHAACILGANSSEINNSENPLSYLALSFAALAVWAFLTYGSGNACQRCDISINQQKPFEIPMKYDRGFNILKEMHKEKWFESGGLASIAGISLCPCSTEIFMQRYKSCFPSDGGGWNLFSCAHTGLVKPPSAEYEAGGG